MPAVSAPPRRPARRRAARAAGWLLLLGLLFAAYLRLSRTYPENSDEANLLLMASDLAHGNLLLSGWHVSDVPFITTELPELAALVRLLGLRLDTAHVAAALTYTVVTAAALALAAPTAAPGPAGRPAGPARPHPAARAAVVVALLAAPQAGTGVFVLLLSVGHIGTAAPVLLSWLVLDRLPGRPGRAAALAGLLLAWALLADPLVLVLGVVPVLVTAAVRLVTAIPAIETNGRSLPPFLPLLARARRELSLAAAALTACLAAWCGQRLLAAAGGYSVHPVPWRLDPPGTWWAHGLTALHGLLALFGADALPGGGAAGFAWLFAVTRLACAALAAAGVAAAARRFFRPDADLVGQLLLTGIVANLAAYVPSSLAAHSALNAREFAPVLPFAAVLAARLLGDRIGAQARRRRPVAVALALLLGWYGAGLGRQAAAPAAADPFRPLAAALEARHLRAGIGGYWDASIVTVDTGGAVTIRAVLAGCLRPYDWESRPAWYAPGPVPATFVLSAAGPGYFGHWQPSRRALAALAALDPPRGGPQPLGGGYVLRVYHRDVLAALPHLPGC